MLLAGGGGAREDGARDGGVAETSVCVFRLFSVKAGLGLALNALRPTTSLLGGTGRVWRAVRMMDPGVQLLEEVVDLFAQGKLRVLVDSEWPFDRALEGYDVLLTGHDKGKVIIRVD